MTPGVPQPRPRPSRWWFVVGAVLVLAALAVFLGGLFLTISSATATDATFDVRDGEVTVDAPADERRMLFVTEGSFEPRCTVRDGAGERELDDPRASTTITVGGREWEGFATFDSGDGDLRVSCEGQPVEVRVGEPLGAGFVVGLLVTILLPLVLGLAGLVVLIVTTVRFATRPAPR